MLATITEGIHRNMPMPRIGPVLLFVLMFVAATVFHLQIAARNVLALPVSAAGFEWTLTRAISGLRAIGEQQ